MKKLISFILAMLMLAGLFSLVSCGEGNRPENTGTVSDSAGPAPDTEPAYEFPEANYNGETFVVYNRIANDYGTEYIMPDEGIGDIVNDAVYTRNLMVEEKYNVVLKSKNDANPCNYVRTDIAAGSVDYDILLDRKVYLATLTVNSVLADFNNLNLDFGNRWWDRHYVTDLSIRGRTYLMQNDVSVAKFTNIRFFYYNKELINSYHLEDPVALYDRDEWILDNFLTMVKGVSAPAADGTLGVYGIVLEEGAVNGVYSHMLTGVGVSYTEADRVEVISEAISGQIDKIETFNGKLFPVFNDKNCALTMDEAVEKNGSNPVYGSHKYDQSRSLWAQGHFLFTQSSIAATNQFRDMKDDYGIMPNPKYNKDQAEYAHKCDKFALCFAIPLDSGVDMERLSVIMDYWAYTSTDTLIPKYYDITIKTKRFSDPRSSEIMDVIRDTARYEFCEVFGFNEVGDAVYNGYVGGNFASQWARNKSMINNKLKDFNAKFE